MSTRCTVGIKNLDGTIDFVYVPQDGDTLSMGLQCLRQSNEDETRLFLKSLETDKDQLVHLDKLKYFRSDPMIEYAYLFDVEKQQWSVSSYNDPRVQKFFKFSDPYDLSSKNPALELSDLSIDDFNLLKNKLDGLEKEHCIPYEVNHNFVDLKLFTAYEATNNPSLMKSTLMSVGISGSEAFDLADELNNDEDTPKKWAKEYFANLGKYLERPNKSEVKNDGIRVVVVPPTNEPFEMYLPKDTNKFVAEVQNLVKGDFEACYPWDHGNYAIYCNGNGKFECETNRALFQGDRMYDFIAGTFLIVKGDNKGNDVSLSDEECAFFKTRFKVPEIIYIENGKPNVIPMVQNAESIRFWNEHHLDGVRFNEDQNFIKKHLLRNPNDYGKLDINDGNFDLDATVIVCPKEHHEYLDSLMFSKKMRILANAGICFSVKYGELKDHVDLLSNDKILFFADEKAAKSGKEMSEEERNFLSQNTLGLNVIYTAPKTNKEDKSLSDEHVSSLHDS